MARWRRPSRSAARWSARSTEERAWRGAARSRRARLPARWPAIRPLTAGTAPAYGALRHEPWRASMRLAAWVSSWAAWPAAWRWRRWIAFGAGLLWLAGYLGAFGTLDESVGALARRPSASEWFTDSMSGRQEAKLVLFLFLV